MANQGKTPQRAWQRMLSGRRLDLLNPSPLDIEIEDIAHGLARLARWNGQTTGDWAFSVAQHSLLVEEIFSQLYPKTGAAEKLVCLLHDAAEYVIGDIISPFKNALGINYRQFEKNLAAAIRIRFGLPAELTARAHKNIKNADQAAAWLEAVQLAGFESEIASNLFGAAPEYMPVLTTVPPHQAKELFLNKFYELQKQLLID